LNLEGSLSVLIYGTDHLSLIEVDTYWLSTVGAVVGGVGHDVVSVDTLGWLETHVVEAGLDVLTEAKLGGGGEDGHHLVLISSTLGYKKGEVALTDWRRVDCNISKETL
jgi:hypothetical protein